MEWLYVIPQGEGIETSWATCVNILWVWQEVFCILWMQHCIYVRTKARFRISWFFRFFWYIKHFFTTRVFPNLGMFIMALATEPNKIKQFNWWFLKIQNCGYLWAWSRDNSWDLESCDSSHDKFSGIPKEARSPGTTRQVWWWGWSDISLSNESFGITG